MHDVPVGIKETKKKKKKAIMLTSKITITKIVSACQMKIPTNINSKLCIPKKVLEVLQTVLERAYYWSLRPGIA